MKIVLINGSPRKDGNTSLAAEEMARVFYSEGIEPEIIRVGGLDISGCKACGWCHEHGKCVKDDIVNETAEKFRDAGGLVVLTPVYYASPNGSVISFLDRLFYSSGFDKTMKVGASVAVARRGGCSATFDVLNKYFTISGMPVASSYYWNSVHGRKPGEAKEDPEGLSTIRMLAKNMSFLMKSIGLGIEKYGLPEREERVMTSFVR